MSTTTPPVEPDHPPVQLALRPPEEQVAIAAYMSDEMGKLSKKVMADLDVSPSDLLYLLTYHAMAEAIIQLDMPVHGATKLVQDLIYMMWGDPENMLNMVAVAVLENDESTRTV